MHRFFGATLSWPQLNGFSFAVAAVLSVSWVFGGGGGIIRDDVTSDRATFLALVDWLAKLDLGTLQYFEESIREIIYGIKSRYMKQVTYRVDLGIRFTRHGHGRLLIPGLGCSWLSRGLSLGWIWIHPGSFGYPASNIRAGHLRYHLATSLLDNKG